MAYISYPKLKLLSEEELLAAGPDEAAYWPRSDRPRPRIGEVLYDEESCGLYAVTAYVLSGSLLEFVLHSLSGGGERSVPVAWLNYRPGYWPEDSQNADVVWTFRDVDYCPF